MGSIGISEFSFGYAFLYEQTLAKWPSLKAAPILPSLQREKEVGWDAHLPTIGTDFYYQFKLSDYLSRRNAKYISNETYLSPYYRLSLHRKDRNQQHRRLREHSVRHPNTYYVAPEFDSIEEFDAAFLSHQIERHSRLIPVNECDDIDDDEQHCITFQTGSKRWLQHSAKKMHDRSYSGEEIEQAYDESRDRWKPIDEDFAVEVLESARLTARHAGFRADRQYPSSPIGLAHTELPSRASQLLAAADLLAVSLGVTLVIVGSDGT